MIKEIFRKLIPAKKRELITVQRDTRSYVEQQGWTGMNARLWQLLPVWGELRGYYRTRYGSFKGKITIQGFTSKFYIYDPPSELRSYSHWSCFNIQPDGSYFVHFTTPPQDIDSGIMMIERIIVEAYTGRKVTV